MKVIRAGVMEPQLRVGLGYDLHRLEPGRPLILGGIRIPFEAGLKGHSDADVVLHALCDALLGAAGLPDIGECFPDTDPAYAGVDSRLLVEQVIEKVRDAGWRPANVDVVIHAERPKLSSYKRPMAVSIAEMLHLDPGAVSVKAKTNEGLDAVGRGEAIACTVIVLVSR